MKKYRIVEETLPSGEKRYCIQKKKTLFFGLIETNKWEQLWDDQTRVAYPDMKRALDCLGHLGVVVSEKVVYEEK